MRKLLLGFMAFSILMLSRCGKDKDDNPTTGSGTFEVKINGTLTKFTVQSATLLRSNADNMKRMDITGITPDGSQRLVVTIGDTPAAGNAISVKNYAISLFEDDNPATPEDESEGNENGFITYSQLISGNWYTGADSEHGNITVTSCDANTHLVSGTFSIASDSGTDEPDRNFTEGKFSNITYLVVN